MRRGPERDPTPRSSIEIVAEERVYQFLTPVFGGGVQVEQHKKHADPITPVRVPSIRGQLRFWWRACNPRGCTGIKELLAAETEVFGAASAPSPLSIAVKKQPGLRVSVPVLKDRFGVVDNRYARAYGAFPLRDTNNRGEPEHGVLHDHPGEWVLSLRYPSIIANDVEAAFWAWAHFGGLGGRTRRGFGAIAEVGHGGGGLLDIKEGWGRFVRGVKGVAWPHLPALERRRLRARELPFMSGPEAQEYLLGLMMKLRQVDVGRKKKADDIPGNHPGRSYWPEPDAIRKLMRQRSHEHAKPVTDLDAFPRAVFGMPIIFHFKDRGDPQDAMLTPRNKGRLASPLILRPHRRSNGHIEAMALVLEHPEPPEVVLTPMKGAKEAKPVRWRLTKGDVHFGLNGRPSPLVTNDGRVVADPLDRFLEEIR